MCALIRCAPSTRSQTTTQLSSPTFCHIAHSGEKMNTVKFVLKWLCMFATGILLVPGNASAQWTPAIKVSDAIEGGLGGVSTARCENTIVVGFGDAEPNSPNSYDGFAVSKNGGASFIDGGTLPV